MIQQLCFLKMASNFKKKQNKKKIYKERKKKKTLPQHNALVAYFFDCVGVSLSR